MFHRMALAFRSVCKEMPLHLCGETPRNLCRPPTPYRVGRGAGRSRPALTTTTALLGMAVGGLLGTPAGAGAWQAGPASRPDLDAAFRKAARVPALTSLLVARGDSLLGERYFHGGSAGRVVNVKSISKSVLSALVGTTIAEGEIRDTGRTLGELLPDYVSRVSDARKRAITVGDLLSMRAGLATTSFGEYGAWVTSADWILAALRRPLECEPGTCWIYSTGNYHLLSVILTRATGVDTRTYAARKLLGPLGIPARPWDRDPRGYYLGGNNMGFTARELLRFGQLYLAEGRWRGRQVVPADWVRRSLRPLVVSSFNGFDYGYGWWGRRLAGEETWFAWGYGGQYVILVPRLSLVVVATAAPGREESRFEADRALFRLLEEEVIPVLRGGASARRLSVQRVDHHAAAGVHVHPHRLGGRSGLEPALRHRPVEIVRHEQVEASDPDHLAHVHLAGHRSDALPAQVGARREAGHQQEAPRSQDAHHLGQGPPPLFLGARLVQDPQGHHQLEGVIRESAQVVHGADRCAPLGLGRIQHLRQPLPRPLDHRLRGVQSVDIEASLGQVDGVAPRGAAEVQDAGGSRLREALDDPHQPVVGIASGESLHLLRAAPELVGRVHLSSSRQRMDGRPEYARGVLLFRPADAGPVRWGNSPRPVGMSARQTEGVPLASLSISAHVEVCP